MPEKINPRRMCFGCGDMNACGLQLNFRLEGNKATAEFVPEERYQGYPGLVHGGVTATALDEAMADIRTTREIIRRFADMVKKPEGAGLSKAS